MTTTSNQAQYTMERAETVRKELGVTQRYLAQAMGLNPGTWGYWVSAKKFLPSQHSDAFIATARALKQLKEGKKLVPEESQPSGASTIKELLDGIEVIELQVNAIQGNKMLKHSLLSLTQSLKNAVKGVI